MKKEKIIKVILCVLGGALAVNAVVLLFTANFNLGILLELFLGAVMLLCGCMLEGLKRKVPLWLSTTVFIGIAAVLIFGVFLVSYGAVDTVKGDEDAIVVLGCGIRGETLTVGLKNRLDSAIECYENNNNALIIVSGGQGPQEDITEALAMERYLISCGIPSDAIIKEEKATSTYENFLHTKEILDTVLGDEYKICYVTNEYHVFRAGFLAKESGFEQSTHAHSSTLWYTAVSNTLREMLAVMKAFVIKR